MAPAIMGVVEHFSPRRDAEVGCQRDAWEYLFGAFGGIRTPNLLIRSQMLYPLSYERLL